MANPRRIQRLQKIVQQTAAQFIQRDLDDPRLGLVSITHVKLSSDLSRAQLYWSAVGTEAEVRTCQRGLTDALGAIQRAVAGSMQTRTTPRLTLQHDEGMQNAQRLEEIFTKLRQERVDPALDDDAPEESEEAGLPVASEDSPEDGSPDGKGEQT